MDYIPQSDASVLIKNITLFMRNQVINLSQITKVKLWKSYPNSYPYNPKATRLS